MKNPIERITKLKNLLPLLIFLIYQNPISAKGIHFEKTTLSALLKKAEKEKRMIFIDCCTSWCPPCKRMEKNVFPNDTVGDFYNSHFICAYFDMDKGEGLTVGKHYEIGCYPTYIFIDEKGNLLHRQSGECSATELIAIGNAALTPELQFSTIDNKCLSGKATSTEILRDLQLRKATYLPVDSILEIYMQAQPDTSLSNRENWSLLHAYNPPPSNHMFRYLINHQQEFFEKYTKDSVEAFVETVYSRAMSNYVSFYGVPDTAAYRKLRTEVVNLHLSYSDHFVSYYDMDYYILLGNPDAFAKTACRFLNTQCDSTSLLLINFITQKFYLYVTDTTYLDTAIFWATRSVALEPNLFSTDNYAHLLLVRGRKQEAEVQALSAIQFAEKMGRDGSEQKELLRKIRAMK